MLLASVMSATTNRAMRASSEMVSVMSRVAGTLMKSHKIVPRALFGAGQVFDFKDGAGEGNRTLVISLEGFCSRRGVADVLEKDNGWSHSILKSRGSEDLHFPLGPSCHPFVGRFVATSYLLHITS